MLPPTTTPPVPAAASNTNRIDAYQADRQPAQGGFGQAFNNAMDQFGARAAEMQVSMRTMAAGASPQPAGSVPAPATVGPAGRVGQPGQMQNPMGLMVDSFNFAIQASLLSRAATQFTGSVSTLMKGQ